MNGMNMDHATPEDYEHRLPLWIKCSERLVNNDDPYIPLSVENLGRAEKMLLNMEAKLTTESQKPVRDTLLMECSAHSIMWIFGLYEVLRKIRDIKTSQFDSLEELFQKLEVIRMPLAKHEVKTWPKYRKKLYYPTSVWSAEDGRVGWHVFDPVSRASETFLRTDLADEFLSLIAIGDADA